MLSLYFQYNKFKWKGGVIIIGVYCITNKINHKQYVGASVCVRNRKSDHFGRNVKLYSHLEFYKEIKIFGRNNFDFIVLEECSRENLLQREQYWYDKLLPEYNTVRPSRCNFTNPLIQTLARNACKTQVHKNKLKQIHESDSFIQNCREGQRYKYRAVIGYRGEDYIEFESLQSAARYIKSHTKFNGKSMSSKIKEVCDGTRKSAFGYKWKYKKV